MLKNYVQVALRNLRKNKVHSLINIVGLAVGLACCIVIVLYVQNQLGYDRFNKHADRIYRPVGHIVVSGHTLNLAMCPAPLGPAIKRDFPQVVAYTRLRNFGTPVLRYGDKVFNEPRFLDVDSTFFDVFTVHFLEGNPKTALTKPNSVVLTESMARKYFGNADPMGKILVANDKVNWMVTGVIEDWPKDSHFKFDFLGSLSTYGDSQSQFWLSNNYYTYLLLNKGTNPASFQKEMNKELMERYISPDLKQSVGVTASQFMAAGGKIEYSLEPLTSIHLYSHLDYELQPNGYISYMYVFTAIAIAILLVACVNFVNLATARSEKRSKEVCVRKALGSDRKQLIWQFLIESVLMSLLAVVLAIGLVELFLPLFNSISGELLGLDLTSSPTTIPLLLGVAVLVGTFAGSYPAFYLSSFEPVKVLKSESNGRNSRAFLRGGLVVFQFVVAIVLFIGTFVIYSELRYIQNKDLGFDKQQVIVIKRANDLGNRVTQFKHDLEANPQIVSVSSSSAVPGDQEDDWVYWLEGTSVQDSRDMRQMWCDYNFLKTYGITLAAGRFFSRDHPSDSSAVLVNQQAEAAFGVKDLVGRNLASPGRTESQRQIFPIIGVVKDFNFQSLHEAIRPLAIELLPPDYPASFVSVRVRPGDYPATISFIERTWKKYAGDEPLEYSFLDQDLAHLYIADQRTSQIATIFSVLAIFVACLGLLGLVAFVTERRTKEIGIRKVLGASIVEIVALLTSEFVKWVLIANVIAWPVAYFVMNWWLQNFAYRVNLGIWTFVLSGLLALVIALITVGSHTMKAATANPIKALRYE
jgi:putative ABC transport system permease protein